MDQMKNEYEREITDYKNVHDDQYQKERYQLIIEKDQELKLALNDIKSQLISKYQPEINRLQLEVEKMIKVNEELLNTQ